MSGLLLGAWLVAGLAAWATAGRTAPALSDRDGHALWAGPALGGAAAVTTLATLDTDLPAFSGVATRAAAFWVLGAALFVVGAHLPVAGLVRMRWVAIGSAIALQAVALALGQQGGIVLTLPGVGRVLVSDIARFGLIVGTAGVLSRSQTLLARRLTARSGWPLLVAGTAWLASAAISLAARDTGGGGLTTAALAVIAYIALGRPRPTLVVLGLAGAGVGVAALCFPHAVARLGLFFSPSGEAGIEQTQMALFASSSGHVFGVGADGSGLDLIGSTLDDDFLIAAVGRVAGLCGVVACVLAGAAVASACLRRPSAETPADATTWIAFAAGGLLTCQLFLSVGGVFGVIPETGVPVPLVTGSGTSSLVWALLLGLAAHALVVPRSPRTA